MRQDSNWRPDGAHHAPSAAVGSPPGGPVLARRSLLKALGAGTAALAVPALSAGCGTSNASSRTSIVFEETKPEVVPYFNNLVARFNASQSSVFVTHDFTSSLIADFVRGTPPDIDCDNYNLTTSLFVARGVLANLAGLPQARTIDPNVQALVSQYARYGQEVNVLPYSIAAEGVVYNVELFDKAGVAIPTTWSEFIAACEKFMSKKILPIYETYGDAWTIQQGLFDYTVGGKIDVAAFYQGVQAAGTNFSADSPVSFQKDFTAPCKQMLTLAPYTNPDAASRHYGDGNTAFAAGAAAMYLQGPWAIGEILAINPKLKMGTFPLPATDNAADTKCRVNLDLAIWLPRSQPAGQRAAALKFLDYLMQPKVMNAYNAANLAFSPLKNAPAQTNPLVAGLDSYVKAGRFYQGAGTYVPNVIPLGSFIQEMVLTGNVTGFVQQMDANFRRLAIRTAA
jgi:raffinose/stachyose/melibiose transport system substrate-binding protein